MMAVNDTECQTQGRQGLNGHRDRHPTEVECCAERWNDRCPRGRLLPFEIYCGCSRMIFSKSTVAFQTVLPGSLAHNNEIWLWLSKTFWVWWLETHSPYILLCVCVCVCVYFLPFGVDAMMISKHYCWICEHDSHINGVPDGFLECRLKNSHKLL